MKKTFFMIVLAGLLVLLITSVMEMPGIGSIDNPAYNEVTRYYVENAVKDSNAPNIIAAIITDYRAFDTLGETTVLFTSIAAVISVLSLGHHHKEHNNSEEKVEKHHG